MARALAEAREIAVDDLAERFPSLPAHPWREPPRSALLLPIPQQGSEEPAGVFVACLNRYRRLDDAYRRFLELLVAQLAAGLANARAYLEFMEEQVGIPVVTVGVGPARDEIVWTEAAEPLRSAAASA